MKNKYLIILLFIFCMPGISRSQCSETEIPRVLLVGDSWAAMMSSDNAIGLAFDHWGHSNYTFFSNAVLAENGTQTTDFIQQTRLDEIQTQLLAHPTIDYVHLSLGGNDVLGQWNKNWSTAKTDSLLDSVTARLVTIMDFIKTVRPGIHIVWSGYCYPNFGEIIGDQAPFQSSHPFYTTWNNMGQPSFTEINGVLNYYSSAMSTLANNDPQLDFVNATGLMQYVYGQSTPMTVPPNASYPAFTAPLPLGYPAYPSPKSAMRNYVIFKDCFHLAPASFVQFIEYQTRKFYQKALMDDQYLLSAGSTLDGSVSSSGNVSSSLMVGNSNGENYSAILTFNTTAMPDTGVAAASIFLRRSTLTGTNPIGSAMELKVSGSNFGTSVNVEAADYQAPGDASGTPCQFGTSNLDGGWIRLEIPASLLTYISHNAATQFMLSAPGATGLVTFTDAADPELAPVLNVTYGPQPTGLQETNFSKSAWTIYPNPSSGMVWFKNNKGLELKEVLVSDMVGKIVFQSNSSVNSVDLSQLVSGMYLISVTDFGGHTTSFRIIRD